MSEKRGGGRLRRSRWLQRSIRTQVILASIAAFALAVLGWVRFASHLAGED